MKLYVTYTSPYARLARIVVMEKALEDRVEILKAWLQGSTDWTLSSGMPALPPKRTFAPTSRLWVDLWVPQIRLVDYGSDQ